MTDLSRIRNFSIIAHIDHGKSTLADRFIQHCGGLTQREMAEQVLDSLDIERERGITIKAQSVTLFYEAKDGQRYQLNFIDTPGHVDFSYEVSRSLAACEGALLVVDAGQGVEAQSVATCYTAIEQGLEVIPVLNKMDLPQADPDKVRKEIEEIIGIDASAAVSASAKTGMGITDILEELIRLVPAPVGDRDAPLQALIIDSWFDNYLGVVSLVRVKQGTLKKGDKIITKTIGKAHLVDHVGYFDPKRHDMPMLQAGEVGYIIAGIKEIQGAPVGDTITHASTPDAPMLPGFRRIQPQVYAGLYPVSADDFEDFRDALAKLTLNDASLFYEPESSDALGFGFRCGFLGMLHMEIIQQRLEGEAGIELVQTAPNVTYQVLTHDGEIVRVDNPQELPDKGLIDELREPIARATFILPAENIGTIMTLCEDRRGQYQNTEYLGPQRAQLVYELPLAEIVYDLYDKLKSATRGYGTLDYDTTGFQAADLVRLDILVKERRVDALSTIVHRSQAERRGRSLVKRLKQEIAKHQFEIPLQAAIGTRVIARETIPAMRKNVTAKCYGGDITRKRKLWANQRAGKKRMKQFGEVEIPQKAFLSVLDSSGDH